MQYIQSENIWSKHYTNKTQTDEKVHYRCIQDKKNRKDTCPAKLLLVKKNDSYKCEIYKSNDHATHKPSKQTVKGEILSLYKAGLKPRQINMCLKEKGYDVKRTTIYSNIKYFNQTHYEIKKLSIGEIHEWCRQNSNIPEDLDKPFIIGYNHSTFNASNHFFKLVVTTKRLAHMASSCKRIHVDATYQLNLQGYPLIVIGNTDSNRSFYPLAFALTSTESTDDYNFVFSALKSAIRRLCNKKFKPEVIVSDGAKAIVNSFYNTFPSAQQHVMCYFHVKQNVRRHKHLIKTKSNYSKITDDIDKLQASHNRETFKIASALFFKKWKNIEKSFCDYFEKVWLKGNSHWYEGVLHLTPSTNNALERFNRTIKDSYTFRDRFTLSKYKIKLFEMVNAESTSYNNNNKVIRKDIEIPPSLWRSAVACFQKKIKPLKSINKNNSKKEYYYKLQLLEEKNDKKINIKNNDISNFINCTYPNFNEFSKLSTNICVVDFGKHENTNFVNLARCSCVNFFKTYMCVHIVLTGLIKKRLTPPEYANPNEISHNPKPGRKPKKPKATKKALVVQ